MKTTISAGEFKAKCLKLMDEVNRKHQAITITKHGRPVAKLIPLHAGHAPSGLFGSMKGQIHILGDIVAPLDEKWDADG